VTLEGTPRTSHLLVLLRPCVSDHVSGLPAWKTLAGGHRQATWPFAHRRRERTPSCRRERQPTRRRKRRHWHVARTLRREHGHVCVCDVLLSPWASPPPLPLSCACACLTMARMSVPACLDRHRPLLWGAMLATMCAPGPPPVGGASCASLSLADVTVRWACRSRATLVQPRPNASVLAGGAFWGEARAVRRATDTRICAPAPSASPRTQSHGKRHAGCGRNLRENEPVPACRGLRV